MKPSCLVFSGGAAQAVVTGLQPAFEAEQDCRLVGSFGAVGTMRDRLVAGESCDVLILTQALIGELAASGHVDGGSAADLGAVATGIAVSRKGSGVADEPPADATALRDRLQRAAAIYVPDLSQSTAGRHIAGMLDRMALRSALAERIRAFPNGAAAMQALGEDDRGTAIGITQVTEIRFAPGVALVAELPAEHALRTAYTAAVTRSAGQPLIAARLVAALTAPSSRALREAAGFSVGPTAS